MIDFLEISKRPGPRGTEEIYPRFIIKKSSDLMVRGEDFYAIWLEDENRWSTDEQDVTRLVDRELDRFYEEQKKKGSFERPVKIMYMRYSDTKTIDSFHNYVKHQMRDSYHALDEKLIFSNMEITKKDYASKKLSYPLEHGETTAYDKLMSTLYSEEERNKIEWAIGSIVSGDSKKIQKFMVLYGAAGTGKSTVLNIIQQLFDGYYSVFDAKSLGSSNNAFALEAFKDNPLVAIQHDGDLSKIEDNTRLNSLVSHETMTVNEKFKATYTNKFKCFLFMGTNNPVKITDAKSGLMRRLIDVSPSGNTLPNKEYKAVMKQIAFELGAIAWHCKEVYESNPTKYDDYIPISMLGASNDFYNFIMDSFLIFKKENGVSLKTAWEMYKHYCEDANVYYPLPQRLFKEELKNYFEEVVDRHTLDDGTRVRNYYLGFKDDKFTEKNLKKISDRPHDGLIDFKVQPSLFDALCSEMPAQYATEKETPLKAWDKVTDKLAVIDTSKLHYVKVPENHIVIDFDIPDSDGEKCYEKNLEEASKWPPTYSELSKSGKGIHLHYIYTGDPSKLSRVYGDHIEIKVFNGKSSLRRKLTKCNDLPIATINCGLPLQEEKKNYDGVRIKSQKKLLELIERNLKKEIHPGTKPSCDFIYKIVEDAYNDGVEYTIPDEMKERIMQFAKGSSHQSDYCVKLMKKMHWTGKISEKEDDSMDKKLQETNLLIRKEVDDILGGSGKAIDKYVKVREMLDKRYSDGVEYDVTDLKQVLMSVAFSFEKSSDLLTEITKMKFASENISDNNTVNNELPIAFYDVEVFPNLVLVVWKEEGEGKEYNQWFNPTPEQIAYLITNYRLIGFNCRRYDNHIIYAIWMGYDVAQVYVLSQKIIQGLSGSFFSEAYNLSYTDIYDFASSTFKKSLKKLEYDMGINHKELGFPWDKPVPEDQWCLVAEYCCNDVMATEAAFKYLEPDWTARQILADLAGMSVNDTTNTLTTRIIFGNVKNPQGSFNYRDLSKPVKSIPDDAMRFLSEACPEMMSMTHGIAHSILPYFPGYKYEFGKSTYRGEEVGEGGYVFAVPGIYTNVALLDIASMHPHSAIAECLFGVEFTTAFREIVEGRVSIKHEAWSKVDKMLGGKLKKHIQKVRDGEMTSKSLANALKTAINSVYGLTSASFKNPFRDERNIDNIVAKRGALFMIDLKNEVEKRGYIVAHIKTDSIKIPGATKEIIDFVMDFGKQYGYTFEHEETYEKMCLVNDAVYIAKTSDGEWTATGTQFQIPYVFKTLFSKEPIEFDDLCEVKSVTTSLYLDLNEGLEEDKHWYQFIGKVGRFCPVKDGFGGGILYREKDGKYYAATGTKGYRWLESESVKDLDYFSIIDMSYYNKLVDEAVKSISQYGDFEWFAN